MVPEDDEEELLALQVSDTRVYRAGPYMIAIILRVEVYVIFEKIFGVLEKSMWTF